MPQAPGLEQPPLARGFHEAMSLMKALTSAFGGQLFPLQPQASTQSCPPPSRQQVLRHVSSQDWGLFSESQLFPLQPQASMQSCPPPSRQQVLRHVSSQDWGLFSESQLFPLQPQASMQSCPPPSRQQVLR